MYGPYCDTNHLLTLTVRPNLKIRFCWKNGLERDLGSPGDYVMQVLTLYAFTLTWAAWTSSTLIMGEAQLGQVAPIEACTKEVSSMVCKKRLLRRRLVDSRWLYNNINVGELLIDCRSREQSRTNTVLGAINIPPPDHDNDCTYDEYIENLGLSTSKRMLRDLLLFSNNQDVSSPKSWLYKLEQFLIEDGRAATIRVLCEGFVVFQKRYPFYTSLGIVDDGVLLSGKHQVSYPNEIVDSFLFLGNMWQAQCKQVVQHLGITHVVNATRKVDNVFENEGVKYFNARLADKPDAKISKFFDAACEFIAQAQRSTTVDGKPCRVLVHCTQGISRSSTLVIVYIMRAYYWSLAQAFNFVHSGRGVVVPNQGFLRVLLQEERRLFHNKCSVAEDELDQLTSGFYPSQPAKRKLPFNAGIAWVSLSRARHTRNY
ncbi:dual specificity [Plasmopara halstedii]|uniref:protein-tyrosine-phosphatase n=1 Tax=Plasmopara halstedii TaxID=4781 RepID=A0A0P1AZX8_PLAHL|nr:dual specificity [Plasmopara halstedii]CEG47137.1 dual specificity [Plasmopara halstedii]|eukprot:XP_024583506.1 dual specificity [Plasmopara halstedii]